MPNINADTLRHLLDQRGMTQADLIEKSKVGKATISRLFSGRVAKQNDNTTKRIAKALDIPIDALCEPIDKEAAVKAQLQKLGVQKLQAHLNGNTWWNFDIVTLRYGISIKDQLQFAPEAIMLLAEASLAERREKLEKRASHFEQVIGNTPSYSRPSLAASNFDQEYWRDHASIQKRDLFGKWYWDDHVENEVTEPFNPDETNPFADFLERMKEKVGADITTEEIMGVPESGLWDYHLCEGEFDRITGRDARARMALKRCYVRLRDIPTELLEDSKTQERIAFLQTKLPDEVWEEHVGMWAGLDLSELGL